MSESRIVTSTTNDGDHLTRSFRPDRSRIWGIAATGLFSAIIAATIALIPLAAKPHNGGRLEGASLWGLIVVGLFAAGMSAWMFLLAWQLRQMRIVVSPDKLELRARRYEWYITNPFGFRRCFVTWPEVRGIRRWQTSNPFAPGGTQENYVLYTNEDRFVLSNLDWPCVAEMANLISQTAGQPIAENLAELPGELHVAALPPRTERLKLAAARGLGWIAIAGGVLMIGLIVLLLIVGPPSFLFIIFAAIAAYFLFVSGKSLRRFRLE